MLQQEQINQLIQKSERGETSLEEETLLLEWIDAHPENLASLARTKNLEVLFAQWAAYEQLSTDEAKEKVWVRWQNEKDKHTTTRTRQLRRWIGYPAVAAIVLAIGIYLYNVMNTPAQQSNVPTVARVDSTTTPSPGTDKAILYLANGQTRVIDDTTNGDIETVDNLTFTKAGGVIYCTAIPGVAAPKDIRYHTLVTPKGGRYQLVLPDRSRVWLNADSRIQFPTIDTGNSRWVYLEGEAFFKVAHNRSKPFIVHTNELDVKATGTRFNIQSYPNEGLSKATLTEGQISVRSGGKEKPVPRYYSAFSSKGSQLRVEKEKNIDKIIAWTNRQFQWDGDSLTTALREIERWYNVTVEYRGARPVATVGNIGVPRNSPLPMVMNVLTRSDDGHTTALYELKGRTLIISNPRLHQ